MARRVLSELSICSPAALARSKQTRESFFLNVLIPRHSKLTWRVVASYFTCWRLTQLSFYE